MEAFRRAGGKTVDEAVAILVAMSTIGTDGPTGTFVVPRSVAQSYPRPDLVFKTVTDAATVDTCIVATADRHDQRVLDFIATAADTLGDQHRQLVAVD